MSLRELGETIACRRCGAAPGFSCITDGSRGGRRRPTYPHADRMRPILATWRMAFGEGMVEALVGLAWRNGRRGPTASLIPINREHLEGLILEYADAWRLELTVEDLRR